MRSFLVRTKYLLLGIFISISVAIIAQQQIAFVSPQAVTQSGTWTVQPGNTANTTAWKVDGSAVTQPVSGIVTANMGTVTADPFGANADAASATGSISAKLRFIAATGIPVTSLPSNASINLAQIAGNTTSTGVGAAGTGVIRVNDTGTGTTGSAVPAQGSYFAGNGSGNLKGIVTCDNYIFDRTTTADVQLVAISGSTTIYVCGYIITGEATTTSDVNLRYATNSNCTTGATNLTPPTTVGTSTSGGMIPGLVAQSPFWNGLKTPASDNLCVHRSAAQTSEIQVWYTQF